jgi:hypothetical protein
MKIREVFVYTYSGRIDYLGINNDQYCNEFSFQPKEKLETNGQTLSGLVIKGNTTLTKEKVKEYINRLIDDAEMDLKE